MTRRNTSLEAFKAFALTFSGLCTFMIAFSVQAAAPTVSSFSPADNATGVSTTTNLIVTFDQTVIASGGTITINVGSTAVETINATDSAVSISSAVVTITPTITLNKATAYNIQISADAFENAGDEQFAGISDTTTWNFTTIGGGAANRQLRAKLLAEMPEYYDLDEPCLADVGIFMPEGNCDDEETDEGDEPEEDTKPAASVQQAVKPVRDEALESALVERRERLMAAAKQSAQDDSSTQEYISPLHQRACERVERRFSGNQKMIDRVNTRLENRFGFTCEL